MTEASRRSFMAVGGAGVVAGATVLGADTAYAAARQTGKAAEESVVAWIPDHRADAVHLMVDEREVVVTDRALVRAILSAAGRK